MGSGILGLIGNYVQARHLRQAEKDREAYLRLLQGYADYKNPSAAKFRANAEQNIHQAYQDLIGAGYKDHKPFVQRALQGIGNTVIGSLTGEMPRGKPLWQIPVAKDPITGLPVQIAAPTEQAAAPTGQAAQPDQAAQPGQADTSQASQADTSQASPDFAPRIQGMPDILAILAGQVQQPQAGPGSLPSGAQPPAAGSPPAAPSAARAPAGTDGAAQLATLAGQAPQAQAPPGPLTGSSTPVSTLAPPTTTAVAPSTLTGVGSGRILLKGGGTIGINETPTSPQQKRAQDIAKGGQPINPRDPNSPVIMPEPQSVIDAGTANFLAQRGLFGKTAQQVQGIINTYHKEAATGRMKPEEAIEASKRAIEGYMDPSARAGGAGTWTERFYETPATRDESGKVIPGRTKTVMENSANPNLLMDADTGEHLTLQQAGQRGWLRTQRGAQRVTPAEQEVQWALNAKAAELGYFKPDGVTPDPDRLTDLQKIQARQEAAEGTLGQPPYDPTKVAKLPPGQKDESVLSGQPENVVNIVKLLDNYQTNIPSGYVLAKSPTWQKALQLIARYDPNFNESLYPVRQRTMTAFTGDGKSALNLRSINTLIGHISRLDASGKALQNFPSDKYGVATGAANWLKDARRKGTQDPRVTRFNADLKATAGELSAIFKGTGVATDREIKLWLDSVDSSSASDQIHTHVLEGVELMKSRLDFIQSQFENNMQLPFNIRFLSPKAEGQLSAVTGIPVAQLKQEYEGSSGGPAQIDLTTGGGAAAGAAGAGGGPVVEWERGPDGKPRPKQ